MTFDCSYNTPLFWLTTLLGAGAIVGAIRLRGWRRSARVALIAAAALLVLASVNATISWPRPLRVIVMVDLSPSTRTAGYRTSFRERVAQLLGPHRYTTQFFADDTVQVTDEMALPDVGTARTVLPVPTDADVVLLFSDGNFRRPETTIPVYAAVDDVLLGAADARVAHLGLRGTRVDVTTVNRGEPRQLSINHRGGQREGWNVPRGTRVFRQMAQPPDTLVARLDPGDAWPENDEMSLAVAPSKNVRVWIGPDAPAGFVSVSPSASVDAGALLGVESIVLHRTAAEQMSDAVMASLAGYVRRAGGALIINGGERAFAAGGWTGTLLDDLSPLASSPPVPQRVWVVLVDASGSMASMVSMAEGESRLGRALSAARAAISRLPPDDLAMLGTFAESPQWCFPQPRPVRQLRDADLSAPQARGPTNLDGALRSLLDDSASLPREVLIISDGELPHSELPTADEFARARVSPSVLLTGPESRAKAVMDMIESTGGLVVAEDDPARWSTAAQTLALARSNAAMIRQADRATLGPQLSGHELAALEHNPTWLRDGATQAGTFTTRVAPAAAVWQVGAGRVVAFAFDAPAEVLSRTAGAFAAAARDERFAVAARQLGDDVIEVIAAESNRPLNGLRLRYRAADGSEGAFQQTQPGRYAASLERSPAGRIVEVVLNDDTTIDRVAIPGRYPEEFDRIGIDLPALQEWAVSTGGGVILPSQTTPLTMKRRRGDFDASKWLNIAAGTLLLLGLVLQHRANAGAHRRAEADSGGFAGE